MSVQRVERTAISTDISSDARKKMLRDAPLKQGWQMRGLWGFVCVLIKVNNYSVCTSISKRIGQW